MVVEGKTQTSVSFFIRPREQMQRDRREEKKPHYFSTSDSDGSA
jgi:hypothetical protein